MHALITLMVSVMASIIYVVYIVDGLLIHWLIILEAMYASARFCYIVRLPICVTCKQLGGSYTVACKPNLYVYALMMESK